MSITPAQVMMEQDLFYYLYVARFNVTPIPYLGVHLYRFTAPPRKVGQKPSFALRLFQQRRQQSRTSVHESCDDKIQLFPRVHPVPILQTLQPFLRRKACDTDNLFL